MTERVCAPLLAAALGLGAPAAALAAVDVAALWDFARPEVSEARFREKLAGASADDAAILTTQIARTHGLRRDFATARSILAPLEADLPKLGAEARVRWFLELGRSWVSATHRAAEKTPEARAAARTAYLEAHRLARDAGLDDLAVDTLHMLPFVETDEAAALRWNRQALDLALASSQPAARRWEASLRNNIGLSLHQLGRFDEALEMFRAGAAAREREGHAGRIRIAHWMVAWTLRSLGRVDEAIEIQLRLERENAAAGTPDEHVFAELVQLSRARGDAERERRYAVLHAQHQAPQRRWYDAALAMRRQAEARGDQPYGAVLVMDGQLVGEGPSRVVERNDAGAHAEREAIRDAQRRLGRTRLDGSVLYSTSRPCAACEEAAAEAGVSRMVHGEALRDAGAPKR